MDLQRLPFRSGLAEYTEQAAELLQAHGEGDAQAIRLFHENHPRFLDERIPWLPKSIPGSEIQSAALELDDARLALARWYSFENWAALENYVEAVTEDNSPVHLFESAVEEVINGDLAGLRSLLQDHPDLVQARSGRRTHFDPPLHRATLLHYIAANGVEGYRQRTPVNAVAIAKLLLQSGADVDALADMYGVPCTTMSLLVSSSHPAQAGVQVALVETLLDYGAAIEGHGTKKWGSPLMTALSFGYPEAAKALVRRGALVDNLAAAAGLGMAEDFQRLLAAADAECRHRALALAAQHGHAGVVALLLGAGEDPNRYNPDGLHSHSTPLHQAILPGHEAVVRVLVENGAKLDLQDKIYQGTPLGWAMYAGRTEIANYLRAQGAK
jgi:ankyrin repeat protein